MKFCGIGQEPWGRYCATIITSGFETIICDTDAALAERGRALAKRYQSLFKKKLNNTRRKKI